MDCRLAAKPPELSIVIAPNDNGTCLGAIVEALALQSKEAGPIEVVVVVVEAFDPPRHDRPMARVDAAAAAKLRLRIVNIAEAGRASAWNHGIRLSAAKLITMCGSPTGCDRCGKPVFPMSGWSKSTRTCPSPRPGIGALPGGTGYVRGSGGCTTS